MLALRVLVSAGSQPAIGAEYRTSPDASAITVSTIASRLSVHAVWKSFEKFWAVAGPLTPQFGGPVPACDCTVGTGTNPRPPTSMKSPRNGHLPPQYSFRFGRFHWSSCSGDPGACPATYCEIFGVRPGISSTPKVFQVTLPSVLNTPSAPRTSTVWRTRGPAVEVTWLSSTCCSKTPDASSTKSYQAARSLPEEEWSAGVIWC